MKTRIGLWISLLTVTMTAAPALAGYAYPPSWNEVSVSAGNWADGTMRATRDSADNTAYLKCWVYSHASYDSGYCRARDAAGDYVSCYTTEPRFVDTIRSIKPESRVYFSASGGSCSWIEVHQDSSRLP